MFPQRKIFQCGIFAVGAVSVFILILFVFLVARSRYEKQLAAKIWPVTTPEVFARVSSSAGSAPIVLLLGDSRMAQWDLPLLPSWRVVNAGVNGLTTGELRRCAPKVLDDFQPAVVVLQAGINDLKFIGLQPSRAAEIVSLAADNLAAVLGECTARHCQVVILKTWPTHTPSLLRRLVWSAKIPAAVEQLNTQLEALDSPTAGIRVVDLFREASLKFSPEQYRDTLHFKPETYRQLTPALALMLETNSLPKK